MICLSIHIPLIMSISIQKRKILEMALLFMSKGDKVASRMRLHHLILLVDINVMDRFILGVTDDPISCAKGDVPKLKGVIQYIKDEVMNDPSWKKYIKKEKLKGKYYYYSNPDIPLFPVDMCSALNQTEINEVSYVSAVYGNLTTDALDEHLYDLGLEWSLKNKNEFDAFSFYKSYNFNDIESRHRQKFLDEHFANGEHDLHEVILNRQKLA